MEIDALRAAQWQTVTAQSPTSSDRSAQPPDVVQAVKAVNESALFGQQYELTFNMDPNSHRTLLRLVDRNTKEVVRQIPPDYVLRLARDVARNRTPG
jgi:flagellar protein FlaG